MTVSSGTKVSIEYTLRLEDKAVIDTNVGAEPLTYVHGSGQIVSGKTLYFDVKILDIQQGLVA